MKGIFLVFSLQYLTRGGNMVAAREELNNSQSVLTFSVIYQHQISSPAANISRCSTGHYSTCILSREYTTTYLYYLDKKECWQNDRD